MRTNKQDREHLYGLLRALNCYRSGILKQENPTYRYDRIDSKADKKYGLKLLRKWLRKHGDYFIFLRDSIIDSIRNRGR